MTNEQLQKSLLIFAGIVLIPVAISYGVVPEKTLTGLYGFPVDTVNLTNIFRAQMGLCLGHTLFWFLGAFKPNLRRPAMYSLVVLMLGLAAGRALSSMIDGIPEWGLTASLIAELIMGLLGLILIMRENKTL